MPTPARGARAALAVTALALFASATQAGSLRFHGNGVNDVDRVKIRIDDPSLPADAGPPIDVGAGDFTIEFFVRGTMAENPAGPVACGPTNGWINGHIVIDRDRYNQGRNYGVSFGGGRLAFGVMNEAFEMRTVCTPGLVLDGAWHHVALQRRFSDGFLQVYVDGALAAGEDGPGGDLSYPDDGVPGDYCGGPCDSSDPFVVLGAEKHDAGATYPSFAGWLDELRYSSVLRYMGAFTPPATPFAPDSVTVALYHFDEGAGDHVGDDSAAPGGPSHGERRFGGNPAGPEWSVDSPFAPPASAPFATPSSPTLSVAPNPVCGAVVFDRARADGELPADELRIVDVQGRERVRLAGRAAGATVRYEFDARAAKLEPGVYLALPAHGPATRFLRFAVVY